MVARSRGRAPVDCPAQLGRHDARGDTVSCMCSTGAIAVLALPALPGRWSSAVASGAPVRDHRIERRSPGSKLGTRSALIALTPRLSTKPLLRVFPDQRIPRLLKL